MRVRFALAAGIGALALAGPALAASVHECDGVTEQAVNIVEPWEANARAFYQGKVRVAYLDTGGEPACCSGHLLVMFSDDSEPGGGIVCKLVSDQGARGFAGIDFASLTSRYDPARGLLLTFRYSAFPEGGDGSATQSGTARVRVNVGARTVSVE